MSKVVEVYKKLDPESEYILTKIQIKNVESRYMIPGDKTQGLVSFWDNRLCVGNVVLSPIVDYSENTEHFVVETKNSVYTLAKANNNE